MFSTKHSFDHAVGNGQCAVCTMQCAVCSVQCAMCSVQCADLQNGKMKTKSCKLNRRIEDHRLLVLTNMIKKLQLTYLLIKENSLMPSNEKCLVYTQQKYIFCLIQTCSNFSCVFFLEIVDTNSGIKNCNSINK